MIIAINDKADGSGCGGGGRRHRRCLHSKYWEKKNTHWNWGILSTKNTNTNSSIRFDRILLQSSVLIENKTFDTIQIGFTFRIGKRKKNEIDM
ncbi:hypothetical protein QR98_0075080 [Sarcoptes scabiei]|uniref:Uncharacterized protein n=1 Tax=Sarcoptes scabiei TaxID=52283 RepID=A0A132ADP5_SARSC|nr:hypothetical protein QR98_0075080 [Sarcoptes scabiei]